MAAKKFLPGDRVRVDPAYGNTNLAGRTGKVARYPEGTTPQQEAVWIEFDVAGHKAGAADGAEVDVDSLRHVWRHVVPSLLLTVLVVVLLVLLVRQAARWNKVAAVIILWCLFLPFLFAQVLDQWRRSRFLASRREEVARENATRDKKRGA